MEGSWLSMQITTQYITVRDLSRNYIDQGDQGVFTYNPDASDTKPSLVCRPQYQRAFVYTTEESVDLIKSIMNNYPIGLFYWMKTKNDPDHSFELMDGQQRTISICSYINGDFAVDAKFFYNLTDDEQKQIMDYKIMVNICDGSDSDRISWFEIVNKHGEPLSNQELRNAVYAGPWLSDAKMYFSKLAGPAVKLSDGYVNPGKINRQELLEKALKWIDYRDGYNDVKEYMAKHQLDKDAQDLWQYFQDVINWAKKIFPKTNKKLLVTQDWGKLYHDYQKTTYNPNDLQAEIDKLMLDDEVTKNGGIVPYVLSDETAVDRKLLHLRTFTQNQMQAQYKKQDGICPICHKHYELSEMEGDHIVPWSAGGKTESDNLQMLCKHDNQKKSNDMLNN